MSTALVALLGLVTVIVSNLGVYLVARRSSTGEVDTSTALDLWNAADQLRRDLTEQATFWHAQWTETQLKLDQANKRIDALEEAARGRRE